MPTREVDALDRRELQDIADALARSRKVVVVTGAGISTNSGIPDFRSEAGLYSLIQTQYSAAAAARGGSEASTPTPDLTRSSTPVTPPSSQERDSTSSRPACTLPSSIKGRDLFDALVWTNPLSTSIFYTFIASLRKKIREDIHHTTHTHKFIRALRDGGRLVRCYTQNIDGLEARDGLCTDMSRGKGNRARFTKKVVEQARPEEPVLPGSDVDGGCEVVQLHGDLDDLRCALCNGLCSWEEADREARLLSGEAPECGACAAKDEARRSRGQRGTTVGLLRPNIVLYGEEHPAAHVLSPMTTHDIGLAPDTLLILGTSLRVHGLKVLVKEFAKAVHARGGGKGKVIFVNHTKPPESVWSDVIDYWVAMDCDAWVEDLRERRADLWERQGTLKLPVVKPASGARRKSKGESQKEPEAIAEADKENTRAGKGKKARPPAASRPTLGKKVTAMMKQTKANVLLPKKARSQAKAPRTPSKPTKPPGTDTQGQQLPTPPTSGASVASSSPRGSKRRSGAIAADDAGQASPCKRRRKALEVWVDVGERSDEPTPSMALDAEAAVSRAGAGQAATFSERLEGARAVP
ncbi:MAG: hypothetical protein M1832_004045 [Thelocarpon impressellum]|nr:MAG: hypothetical protein M1832_004045 [Thelocarpon impressellum]